MCGIIGYVGPDPALDVVLDGLRRLEYRGYDSAGVAILNGGSPQVHKKAGKLANLEKELDGVEVPGTAGIGHTRWATHGGPTDRNAHPHTADGGALALIHNGIVENHAALRAELESRGTELVSETDTEVVAHLLAEQVRATHGDLAEAMRRTCRRLAGAFSLVAVHRDCPDLVVGARRHSPLVVGAGSSASYLASDVSAFIAHTRDSVEIGEDCVVALGPGTVDVTHFSGAPASGRPYHVDWDLAAAEKGGHPYFMLKEIAEQPQAVADTLRGRLGPHGGIVLDEERLDAQDLRDVDKVFVVACGSAYHAGMITKYAIERWTHLPCEVEMASEFRYRDPVLDRSTLVVAITQSGETLDTLMAVKHAREQKAKVLAICNTNGSTVPRESDAVLYTRAGPEVGVAATKTFLTQVTATYLVGLLLAEIRGTYGDDEVAQRVADLEAVPSLIEQTLGVRDQVRGIAAEVAEASSVLFLGRHVGYPVAMEGALKLKELSYQPAEAFPAGELKHGPIALVEDGTPVVVVVPSPRGRGLLHGKILSNIQEVRARGARTILIAEEGDTAVEPFADHLVRVPHTHTLLAPLVTTVPLQILACETALARGLDVDQPRNLAKSVTVE